MSIIKEIKEIKSGAKELREFGLVVGGILAILGIVALFRGKASGPYLLAPGVILPALGLAAPGVLAVPQKLWMCLGIILGFFMSRVVLFVLFFLVITPISVILKILGKDILDQKIEKDKPTYWLNRDGTENTSESYENQY